MIKCSNKLFLVVIIAGALLALVGCSTIEPSETANEKVEVVIGQSIGISSRTYVAEDGRTAVWSADDQIAIWAKRSNGDYALQAEPFKLWHFNDTFSQALFSAFISPMADDTYILYATSPVPVSVEGDYATFSLAEEQNASSFAGNDILVASPIDNASAFASGGTVNDINFSFAHKMHVLKITIPAGRNLMEMPITRIEFDFSTGVTGDVTVNYTDPSESATLSNSSNRLVLNIPDGLADGDSAYGVIFPTDISGDITYKAYAGGYQSYAHTITIAKNAEQAHITPLSLAIPEMYRMTEIILSTGENHLGEDVQSVSLVDADGNAVQTLPANPTGRYAFAFEGVFNASTYSNKQFSLQFESESAIVSHPFVMPTITPYIPNTVAQAIDIPYLFEEDFSSVGAISSNDEYTGGSNLGSKSAVSFLSGWTGGRIGAQAGTAIRIASRRETSADYGARVDSAPLSALKAGASVKVRVSYRYGMNRQEGGLGTKPNLGQTVFEGSTTNSSAIASGSTTGSFVNSFYINETTGSYTNLPHDGAFVIEEAGLSTRISWRTENEHKAGATNGTFWLYIDDVKVSIEK